MNVSFSKFFIVGALAISVSSHVLADSNSSSQVNDNNNFINSTLTDNVYKTIQEQYEKGFLTEKANITISILPSLATLEKRLLQNKFISNNNNSNNTNSFIDYTTSTFKKPRNSQTRSEGACSISLAFDDDGSIPVLSQGTAIEKLAITNIVNEQQKAIAREFLALHENFHCEFSGIETPVIVPNQTLEFNQKISYLLKDQVNDKVNQKLSYINLLNENFADTAAMMSLIKKYGIEDKNLKQVIQSVIAQRHGGYFQHYVEEHFTHFSLEKILIPSNLKAISQANTHTQFIQLALKIANQGTQEAIIHKPIIFSTIFSKNNLDYNINNKIKILIQYQFLDENTQKTTNINPWRDNISRGLSYDIAFNVVSNKVFTSFKLFNSDGTIGEDYSQISNVISEALQNTKMTIPQIIAYSNAESNLEKFKQLIQKPISSEDFDFVPASLSDEKIYQKIATITDTFIQSSKKIKP